MTRLEQLIADRKAALEAAKAIMDRCDIESREPTEEELNEVEANTAKAEELATEIEAAERRIEKMAEIQTRIDCQNEFDKAAPQPITRPAAKSSKPRIIGGEGSREFGGFGEFLSHVRRAATDTRTAGVLGEKLATISGLNTSVDSEGGFLIPPTYSSEILAKMYEMGSILSRVRRIGVSGNTLEVPYINESSRADGSRWGGVQGYWVAEGDAPTATKPDIGKLNLRLKKVGCLGYVTDEQQEDYSATGSMLMQAFSEELVYQVENAIIRGTGAGRPLGILGSPCIVTVTKETNQTSSTLWGPNIVKMWARCYGRSRSNAVWVVNQDVEPYLWSLALEGRFGSGTSDVDAIPLYMPAGTLLNTGAYGSLMGRPVLPVEYCSSLGTLGDIFLADFSQYLLIDKGGPQAAESLHVRFVYGEKTYRVTYRVDGSPWWASALTPANGSNTVSPFVMLQAR